jgi:hypothetical protein
MSIMEAWACEPKAIPLVYSTAVSAKVDPLRALAALESCELVQLRLGCNALPQAYVAYLERFNLDFVYR